MSTPRCLSLPVAALMTLLVGGAPSARAFDFAPAYREAETVLTLRGTSRYRYKGVFKVNAAALYLPADVAGTAVLQDVPKRIEFAYYRRISAEDFIASGDTYLARNLTPEQLGSLQADLERINAAYANVKEGDRYSLTYLPGRGTTLSLNGEVQCTIPGAEFARAYFTIWLGAHPISDGFRDELLGGGAS